MHTWLYRAYVLSMYLAGLLQLPVGHSSQHVTNCIEFVNNLCSSSVRPKDLMVSFNVVSLFTQLPTL